MSDTSTGLDEAVEPDPIPPEETQESDSDEGPEDLEAQHQEELAEALAEEEADEGESEEGEEDEGPEEIEYDFGGGQKVRFKADATAQEVFEEAQKAFKGVEGNFTRKSQEVAEQAKAIEERETVAEKLINLNGEALQTYSHGLALRTELEQLAQIDINQLWQSDPDQARRVSDTISAKQAEFQSTVAKVSQAEAAMTEAQATEIARRKEDGATLVQNRIKNFSESDLVDYAKSQGVSEQDAANWALNPIVAEMAWKAMELDKLKAKAAGKQPAPKPAQAVKSMKAKGAATARVTDPSKMSDAQFRKHLGLGEP